MDTNERLVLRQVREKLVSVKDIVNSFNHSESALLSHLDLPEDLEARADVLEYHLDRALLEFSSWYYSPYDQLPSIVTVNCLPCLVAIARKSLEYSNPREVTINDYERCKMIADQYIELIKLKAQLAKLKDLPLAGSITDLDNEIAAFSI